MRYLLRTMLLVAAMMLSCEISAKIVKTSHLYVFGFSASFKDSVVYVTDIQDVQGAWLEKKKKFLIGREQYSDQLKTFLAEQLQEPGRVCVVFFKTKKKKAEKQYLKLMKKYKKGYDVRYLNATEFKFEAVEKNQDE